MDLTTPRPAPPGRPRRLLSPWMLALIGLVSAPVLVFIMARDEAAHELHYGQFKKRLAQKEIRSARIGPSSITGELTTTGDDARPVRFHTSRLGMENDPELYPMLKDNIPESAYEAESAPSVVQTVLLPSALMVGVMFALVYFLRRSGGLGSAMAFARSKPKVFDKGERQYSFDDVAGNDEAVAELREVVDFLQTPEKFQAVGGRIPKGVLLVGPPGTGKTLLAKAVAGEAGVPFFSLSGSDFCEMYVGVGAARVRSLFHQAEAKAPCLIFIDELDAIGRARSPGGAGSDSERDQTLNQLLVQMDGFDSNRGIILIAATNRPETLDPALVRPGRFDRQVVVDRPDIVGREQILKVHVKQVTLDDAINLRQIAAITSGFVSADLANLVNEAALLAARKGKTTVGELEFQEGVERVIAGPEKRQRVLRPDERQRIAYHEAGHALVARSLPQTDAVHKVTILGRGSAALGYTMYRPEDDQFLHTRTWLRSKLCTLLGGTIAEEVVYGEVSDGATSDLQRATQIARKMVAEFGMSPRIGRVSYVSEGRSPFLAGGGANDYAWSQQTAHEIDQEVRRLLDETQAQAERILTERRDALEAITNALLQRESIDAAELQAILDEHPYEMKSA